MIVGVVMKFIHALAGIVILMCPSSSHAFMVASPMVRVPLGLHMTLSPVNSLKFHRNKALKAPPRTLKRKTRRNMSDTSSVSEAVPDEQKGFWNKVSRRVAYSAARQV